MHFNVALSENLAPENGHDMKQDYKHIWIFNGILIFFSWSYWALVVNIIIWKNETNQIWFMDLKRIQQKGNFHAYHNNDINNGGKGHVEWKQFKQLGMVFLIKDIQLDKFVEKHQNKAHFIIGSKNYYSTLTNFAP